MASAASGAPACATATARLSSTTGEPVSAGQLAVERRDLRPVDLRLGLQRGDRRLQDVRPAPRPPQRHRPVQGGAALLDPAGVPQRAVLVGEQHQLVAGEARRAPGVVAQHQRQQPVGLGLVGHQDGEQAPEADRLVGQLAAIRRSPR